jgi:hypothetical protein
VPALQEAGLKRWAPQFFVERITRSALQESRKELVQREVLAIIAGVLRNMDTRGVLLKGAALQQLSRARGAKSACRAVGDIDLYVAPQRARELHARLQEIGFRERRAGLANTPGIQRQHHHLRPLCYGGAMVEIHTHIAPAWCRLPEREMLQRTVPLDEPQLEPMHTLGGEGLLLHAAVHTSLHLFSHGLKLAWDVQRVLELFPQLDWNTVERWARISAAPRAFWLPLELLGEELKLGVPSAVLKRNMRSGTHGALQNRLNASARRRLFNALEHAGEPEAATKHAVYLLLQKSSVTRAVYALPLVLEPRNPLTAANRARAHVRRVYQIRRGHKSPAS